MFTDGFGRPIFINTNWRCALYAFFSLTHFLTNDMVIRSTSIYKMTTNQLSHECFFFLNFIHVFVRLQSKHHKSAQIHKHTRTHEKKQVNQLIQSLLTLNQGGHIFYCYQQAKCYTRRKLVEEITFGSFIVRSRLVHSCLNVTESDQNELKKVK